MAASIKEQYEKYAPTGSNFYRDHYHHVIMSLIVTIFLLIVTVGVVLYQTVHRPQPAYDAIQANGQKIQLRAYEEPNLLSDTVLQWASKAATVEKTPLTVKLTR